MMLSCGTTTTGTASMSGRSPLPQEGRDEAPTATPTAVSLPPVDARLVPAPPPTTTTIPPSPSVVFHSSSETTQRGRTQPATRGLPSTTTTSTMAPASREPAPRHVEEWRPLVATWFRSGDVDRVLTIIACESSGDPHAWNPLRTPHGHATGLLQHLEDYWPERAQNARQAGYGNEGDIWSPDDQAAVSAWLAYNTPQGFDHWVCNP